jgi:hypothetical protein
VTRFVRGGEPLRGRVSVRVRNRAGRPSVTACSGAAAVLVRRDRVVEADPDQGTNLIPHADRIQTNCPFSDFRDEFGVDVDSVRTTCLEA